MSCKKSFLKYTKIEWISKSYGFQGRPVRVVSLSFKTKFSPSFKKNLRFNPDGYIFIVTPLIRPVSQLKSCLQCFQAVFRYRPITATEGMPPRMLCSLPCKMSGRGFLPVSLLTNITTVAL